MSNNALNCHVVSFAKLIRDNEETSEVATQQKTSGDPRNCHVVSLQYLIRDDDSSGNTDKSEEKGNEKVFEKSEGPKSSEAVSLENLTLDDSIEKIDNQKEELVSLKNSETDEEDTFEFEYRENNFPNQRKIGRCLFTINGDITDLYKENKVFEQSESPRNSETSSLENLSLADSISLKNSETDDEDTEEFENDQIKFPNKRKIGRCLFTDLYQENKNNDGKKNSYTLGKPYTSGKEKASENNKKTCFPKPSKIAKSVRSKLSSAKRCVSKFQKRVRKAISDTASRLLGPHFKAMLTHYATWFIVMSIFLYSDIFTR